MFNFIARYFTSIWAFLSAPFRAAWRLVVRFFPERDFTIMDTPNGNVYSFHQGSFWRFTKFVGKITLVVWASWSTYVFMYHRPLLQKRTAQLEETKQAHARQISELNTFFKKYNELARGLNVIDDKILNEKKLTQAEKDALMKKRTNTWGELDFLQTRLGEIAGKTEYAPEFTKMSELTAEYELTRAQNAELSQRNAKLADAMVIISDADGQIVSMVEKLSKSNIDEIRKSLQKIKGTIAGLGLNESALVSRANKFSNTLVGAPFAPIQLARGIDPKYQKLADNLETWHGLARLDFMLPRGAPVAKSRITSNFGMRADPFNGEQKKHKGIDFAGQIGTALLAIAPGRVISAGERVGYGKTVEVDHGLGFSTLYAHMSQINVARGDWVRPGVVVGLGGNSGRSTGPHLHYEVRYNGTPFNPSNFVKEK